MRKIGMAGAALLCVAAACRPDYPRPGLEPASGAEEAAVYVAVIDQALADSAAPFIVIDEQSSPSHVEDAEQLRGMVAGVDSAFPAEAFADFARRNRVRVMLPRILETHASVRSFSPEALFVPNGNLRAEYDTFRERYAPVTAYHTLSRPGFDAAHRRAVVVTGSHCGALCGHGQVLLLERSADGGWRVVARRGTWVS